MDALKKAIETKKADFSKRRHEVEQQIAKVKEKLSNPGGRVFGEKEIKEMKETHLAVSLVDHSLGRISEKELGAVKEKIYEREFAVEAPALLLKGLQDRLHLIEDERHAFSFIEDQAREYEALKARWNPYRKTEFQDLARGLTKTCGVNVAKDAEEFLKRQQQQASTALT